jgi:hypothetical protein
MGRHSSGLVPRRELSATTRGTSMDRKQARSDYKQALQPMGIVQVKNLTNGRCFIMRSANTKVTINSLRFQLKTGAFATSHELCRDWQTLGEGSFSIEVIDELKPVEDHDHDYDADLRALEELWIEKLQPYGDKGYHTPPHKLRSH